jgi:hypothetical protein
VVLNKSSDGDMAQVVECLPSKGKTLSSVPSTAKKLHKDISKDSCVGDGSGVWGQAEPCCVPQILSLRHPPT